MAPRPAQAAALMDELVEEILLRIPPDDPAHLLRAALVCKRWCRIVSDPGFRRRFREFHRTPPILGFLCSRGPWTSYVPSTSFVSTTSFRPSPARLNYRAVDARHGRVLLHGVSWNHERKHWDDSFVVWDPITGGERARLPLLPRSRHQESNSTSGTWNAAVLCASAAVDDACDHLDCHSGPFLVVFVARGRRWGRSGMCAHVYSSEAAAWSQRIYAPRLAEHMQLVPSALAGNSMYFLCSKSVLKFDLTTREMSLIDLPQETFGRAMLRTTEDSALGLASMCSDGLHLWSMEAGPTEVVGWAQSKVIKLTELPPADPIGSLLLTGFAHGLGVILVCTSEGIFTIDLKSVRVIKVSQESSLALTFPYMSFYTPGYLGEKDSTSEILDSEGWLRTGDLCYIDQDGFVCVVDRLKAIIKYKGYQTCSVSLSSLLIAYARVQFWNRPSLVGTLNAHCSNSFVFELENLLQTHPDIDEAAVVPYPDDVAGELPVAFIVRRPGSHLHESHIKEFVAKQVVH